VSTPDEDDEDEDDVKPSKPAKKAAPSPKRAAPKSKPKNIVADDHEDDHAMDVDGEEAAKAEKKKSK
jgi:hypothetical protein